jgi:cysteine desulfurase
MLPWLSAPGDPGRLHAEGRAARVALETAREQVAGFFGARPREVMFTSGGTEAVNTAVFGAAARAVATGASPRLVVSAVEHSAVLEAAHRAGDVVLAGVDAHGRFDPAAVTVGLRPGTALVSVQLANHEVGTLQPAAAVAAECRADAAPASVHSIPTGASKEDHVPMAPIAVRKCRRVLDNARKVIGMEILCAAQGLDFLKPLKPGLGVLAAHRRLRREIPHLDRDRYLHP